MSIIGKKGRTVKPISSFLKELGDLKLIKGRIGVKQFEEFTDKFVPVFLRYSAEKGVEFCLDHNILELAREGRTTMEILYDKEWKHETMLEDLLNFLTWRGVFKKKGREYQSVIQPGKKKSIFKIEIGDAIAPGPDVTALGLGFQVKEPIGLLPDEKKWVEGAKSYKVVFNIFDRIYSRFIYDSMKTGTQPATLDDKPGQLGPFIDSFLMSPSFIIPRMAVIAAAFKYTIPSKLLDLNCGTGRGVEELLLFNPNTEVIGVTDNAFQLQVAERNLAVFSEQKQLYPRLEWRVVDFSHPLPNQLEDLVGECDMVLVNQLFQFCPHDAYRRLVEEILSFVKAGGVVAFFQNLRAEKDLPWPHEWLFRTIQGFTGIPEEKLFKELLKQETGKDVRELIPLAAYLVY